MISKNTADKIREVLAHDPIAEAERIMGDEQFSEPETTRKLGAALSLAHGRRTRDLLIEAGDSHFGQSITDWHLLLANLGFEKVLETPIEGTGDKFRLFWRNGVLLNTDSYFNDTSINSASITLLFRGQRPEGLTCGSANRICILEGVQVWEVTKDAREGLRLALESLEASGEILSKWPKRPWLWLMDYNQPKSVDFNAPALTEARIAQLPSRIQDAINGK